MRKVLFLFAAVLVALATNAADVQLSPGNKVLYNAVTAATAGDVLILADGVYEEPEVVSLNKNLTIKAAQGAHPVIAQQYYMKLLSSAQVTFIGIKFDGGLYKNGQGANDHCIRPYDDSANKSLTLINCEFCNWKSYILYPQRSNRCMQSMTLNGCYFHDNQRGAIYVETGGTNPLPIAELTVENTTFYGTPNYKPIDIKNGSATPITDPKLRVNRCTFYNCGTVRSEQSTDVIISNSIFAAPEGATYAATTCYAGAAINNCLTFNVSHAGGATITDSITADPLFRDAANGDLHINAGSPVFGAGTDGSDLGDPRWLPTFNYYLVGIMTGWMLNTNLMLEKNPANEAEYIIPMTFYAGQEFKIVRSDGYTIDNNDWYPSGLGTNFIVNASGDYTVYFRPDGQGGSDWHHGYIFAQPADLGPWEAFFHDDQQLPDWDSYISYDESHGKVTAYIRQDKNEQWNAILRFQGVPAEDDKCYSVALKMKANHDINGVTLKWQDNNDPAPLYEDKSINLAADEEYSYYAFVTAKAGNGVLSLDFGYAKLGDIIEIYDVAINQEDCPAPPIYYLVGSMTEWATAPEYLFAENPEVAGEFFLTTTLAIGDAVKVVGVQEQKETWYPNGFGNEYVVDAAHAGETTVYFRPAGNPDWAAFGGYFFIPDNGQGIEEISQEPTANSQKLVIDGQLFIRRDGKTYNMLGELVGQLTGVHRRITVQYQ